MSLYVSATNAILKYKKIEQSNQNKSHFRHNINVMKCNSSFKLLLWNAFQDDNTLNLVASMQRCFEEYIFGNFGFLVSNINPTAIDLKGNRPQR